MEGGLCRKEVRENASVRSQQNDYFSVISIIIDLAISWGVFHKDVKCTYSRA